MREKTLFVLKIILRFNINVLSQFSSFDLVLHCFLQEMFASWLYLKLVSFVKAKVKLGLNEVDYDYIFIMSDKATFTGIYRTEPNQALRWSFLLGR